MTARLVGVPIDLAVVGLQVELDDGWSVESEWGPDGGSDTVSGEDGSRYRVTGGGRTDRDCPMGSPFPIELDGATWIQDGARFCRTLDDVRIEVERLAAKSPREDALLVALARSLALRRLASSHLPAPTSLVGSRVVLDTIGLVLDLPTDGLWKVARPIEGRDFDALVRTVPAFPELQVVVRRHARSELANCDALTRRLETGTWRRDDISKIEGFGAVASAEIIGFRSVALCRESPGELLDVRIASRPNQPLGSHVSILRALGLATTLTEAPPLPSGLARRDAAFVRHQWGVVTSGLQFVSSVDSSNTIGGALGFESGLGVFWKNGLAVTAIGNVGLDQEGVAWGASVDVGVALRAASDLMLVLSLGWLERHEALIDNRALTLGFELKRGYLHDDGNLPWSLRIVAFQLASRFPRVMGAPLEITWQAELFPGVVGGLSWRSVSGTDDGSVPDGIELGIRIGLGSIWR